MGRSSSFVYSGINLRGSQLCAKVEDLSTTWLSSMSVGAHWMASNAALCIMPDTGSGKYMSVVGMTKSSLGASVAIGVSGGAIADDAAKSCFAMYSDLQFEAGTFGYGFEVVVKHKAADSELQLITPYSTDSGSTIGVQINGGGDPAYGGTANGPSTVGLIFTGTEGWVRGIVFQKESIYGATGTTGSGVAIELARTYLIQ